MGDVVGEWFNPGGYKLVKIADKRVFLWITKAIYEFTLDEHNPLTFLHPGVGFIQPDRHVKTDMGSIPVPLQVFWPKDRFLLSYLLHDSAYRHGGLYFSDERYRGYSFVKMEREEVDDLLRYTIKAEGGSRFTRNMIWRGVRIGGGHRYGMLQA